MRTALGPPVVLALLLASPLLGCTVGPDFKRPEPPTPTAWSASAAPMAPGQTSQVTTATAGDVAAWWISFHDPELTSLVVRAQAANLDAREAMLRIAEARAQRSVTAAEEWPSLSVNASAQDNRLSDSTAMGQLFTEVPGFPNPYAQYQLGFDVSWELDLWGHVRRQVEAANADAQAATEDSRAVLVSVLGDVGHAYIDLRGAQAKQQVVVDNIAVERELLDLARQRRAAGLSSDVDPVRAASELSNAEAQLPALKLEISEDINQLSKILAREPGALRSELIAAGPVPPVPPRVPIGLPADLARRRPDIREAEARLHAATAQIGVAVADLYPTLTLGSQGGLQSENLAALSNWASRFVTFGPTLQLPVFDAGRRRATVQVEDVRAKEAAFDYTRAVLAALHEVDNALAAYGADQARRASLEVTVAQDRDAVDLVRQRYAGGVGSYIDVLDAQRTLQQNEISLTDGTTAVSVDLVVLYKALGGGWG